MKRRLLQALLAAGTAALLCLGLFLPRLAASRRERSLAGEVWQKENRALSLTLAQELVELPALDIFQALELFAGAPPAVELEEGRNLTAVQAAQVAENLQSQVQEYFLSQGYVPIDIYWDWSENLCPDQAVPFLLTSAEGVSGVFWRCGWAGRPEEAVWLDDQTGLPVGFLLQTPGLALDMDGARELCLALCGEFYAPEVSADIYPVDAGGSLAAYITGGERGFYASVTLTDGWLAFNLADTHTDTGAGADYLAETPYPAQAVAP